MIIQLPEIASITTYGVGATADLTFLHAGGYVMSAGPFFDHTFSKKYQPTVNSFGLSLALGKHW
jgi:hypothetical protein